MERSRCTACGLCHEVCSGIHYRFPLPENADDLFLPRPLAVYLGHATDPVVHAAGQSGGVATALIMNLMERREISHALVTRMPPDGSLRPQGFFATAPAELMECVGSQYGLNPLNATLREWPREAVGVAVVGLPCHVHGIHNLGHVLPNPWKDRFRLVIGLFCLQSVGFLAIEHFVRYGIPGKRIARIRFRHKETVGERGRPCIEYSDGSRQAFEEAFLSRIFNDMFVPLRCFFCFDQMNRMSDLALGDANGFPAETAKRGLNVIAVYTERGGAALARARQDGAIALEECDIQSVFSGQAILTHRKPRVLSAFSRWAAMGRTVPETPVLQRLPSKRERLSACLTMELLWCLEVTMSRRVAYAKLMMYIHVRNWTSRVLRVLRRALGKARQRITVS